MEWLYLNGFILFLPIYFIRYGVLRILSKDALKRAHYMPEVKQKYMMLLYNVSTALLFFLLFFYKIKYSHFINQIGFVLFLIGLIIYLISIINYAYPHNEINKDGLYKISRNPMYVGFFIYFLGVSFILASYIIFIVLIVYQISCHYIIKSEEDWCLKVFGDKYLDYMKKVRRYI